MAAPVSPFKLVYTKVRDYIAREKKRRKEEEERQSKIEGLRKYERKLRRDKRDAEIARRRAARRADEDGGQQHCQFGGHRRVEHSGQRRG
jgi:hypothetical protein